MYKRALKVPVALVGKILRFYWDLPFGRKLATSVLFATGFCWPAYRRYEAEKIEQKHQEAITDYVFMDFSANNKYIGRVLIGLYGRKAPLSVENFIQLCKGYTVKDKTIGYRNTKIERIINGLSIHGGALLHDTYGRDQLSIYGKSFPDETYSIGFVQDGDVAMLNSGAVGNASRYFITLTKQKALNRRAVVIGTIVKGMKVVREIGKQGAQDGLPLQDIRIIHCGLYRGEIDGPASYTFTDAAEAYQQGANS
ncbi:peptidylprolyl isomerase [Babesia microti strain RI]|uniref:Peptidyl-prolyl cis-trans isomerase n=1 Tax=Babesia microti (strain RI) TaxID=1133968 RepID=I7J998_BABMR|nr:peptidylprolyl isomerase [Babesia microti strain RI]CCF73244.1 peptidylprolyl isomerase [Babesia microti strain RI]|eukprot:XP_012647853.1 peptidylprolyl isomerase [Babesia microti strain RI]